MFNHSHLTFNLSHCFVAGSVLLSHFSQDNFDIISLVFVHINVLLVIKMTDFIFSYQDEFWNVYVGKILLYVMKCIVVCRMVSMFSKKSRLLSGMCCHTK